MSKNTRPSSETVGSFPLCESIDGAWRPSCRGIVPHRSRSTDEREAALLWHARQYALDDGARQWIRGGITHFGYTSVFLT